MPTEIFEVHGLTKVYHTGEVEIRALSNVDLTLYDGELAVLLGPSGSGGLDALAVPLSALFRRGADWSVFRAVDGRARLTKVEIGHRNTERAQIVSGLNEGDRVVLHPSDRIADGTQIEQRQIESIAP